MSDEINEQHKKPANKWGRPTNVPGVDARRLAVSYIRGVLADGRFLDELVARAMADDDIAQMEHRDRALARLIAATLLRHRGEIDDLLERFMQKPLNKTRGNIWPILQAAAVQLLYLDTPPHAAINIAVEQCRTDRAAHRFDKLANAVLRKVSTDGRAIGATQDSAKLNTPRWMWDRWVSAYGEDIARKIVSANAREAALELTIADPAQINHWAAQLGAVRLATGSLRLKSEGRVEELAGYDQGAWWVQDSAAALPTKLFGDVAGQQIADICAAPGGKTAQLAAAGARVTSIDKSKLRLTRLRDNLARVNLSDAIKIIEADATSWTPREQFDALLLDAPCTATGTMRRHPDIAHLKQSEGVEKLAALQSRLLDNCWRCIKPGGLLIYCTCSLEPEEGPDQIAALLARTPQLERVPIKATELDIDPGWITAQGDLRTFPFHVAQPAAGRVLPVEPPEPLVKSEPPEPSAPSAPSVKADSSASSDLRKSTEPAQDDGSALADSPAIPAGVASLDRPDLMAGLDGFYVARLRIKV